VVIVTADWLQHALAKASKRLTLANDLLITTKFSNFVFVHHIVCTPTVHMNALIPHHLCDVLPCILYQDIVSSWVIREKLGEIIHVCAVGEVGGLAGCV
jgi:hypothetical protein